MTSFIISFSAFHFLSLILFPVIIRIFVFFIDTIFVKSRQYEKPSSDNGRNNPPSYPIIGCLISFNSNRTRLLDWYTDLLAKSATNTIVVKRPGAPRTIVTANPENVEYILKTNFSNYPKGKAFTEILGDFLGYGIFNVDGKIWHVQRKLASLEFTGKSLNEYFVTTLEEEVEKCLLPVLETLARADTVFDLQELLMRLSFNMVCKVLLGVDRFSLDPSLPTPSLARDFDMASKLSARRGAAPLYIIWKFKRWVGIGSERELKEAIERVHRHILGIIVNKKKMIEKGETFNSNIEFITKLIIAGHDEKMIRDMALNLIMAGKDTTSSAMTWLFWLLSCNKDIDKEAVLETKQLFSGYESLKELKLLKACLCESMRLYPPVAWDSKHAVINDMLPDNTKVMAGDRVTYFPYGMGRMETLWGKDWYKFKPERWFEKENDRKALRKVCPYKFPIFQAGPRVCLGKEMAFIQMKYVVASILKSFEVVPISTKQPVFVPHLTAHMAGGFNVRVRRRTL